VLVETLDIAEDLGLTVHLLESLDDIDRPEDLPVWEREAGAGKSLEKPDIISVIIPALNEADNISRALSSACQRKNVEVIVVDGGSSDGTIEMAESMGAKVLHGAPPRGRQMNAGAMTANGAILLFLHADTALPDRFEESIRSTLAIPGVAAGAFELKIDSSNAGLRAIERVANFRSRRMSMPYGDQAIFIRADVFRGIKGFPDIPIMEDFELMRRLRRITRVKILSESVRTSARRWERLGIIRTTVLNQLMIVGYCLGVAPARLARWYGATNGVYDAKKPSHRQ
jgi:rSAM/selenodomain-associated transferase 2